VFRGAKGAVIAPQAEDVLGFAAYMERYEKGLVIERTAVAELN
jgi:hypothetical protein